MRAFLLLSLDHSATSHQSRCVYFLRRYYSILYMGGLDFSLLPGSGPGECVESVVGGKVLLSSLLLPPH